MFTRSLVHCLVATLVLFLCGSVQADTWQFNVSLDGLQEVPPNASPATGTAIVLFDDVSGAMSVNGTFTGFTGLSSNAHVHGYAGPGTAAGVVFGLTFTPGATSGTFSGNGFTNIANTLNGLTYINVHSQTFPGGEIRGQIANGFVIPEPGSLAVLGGLALTSLVSRRRRR
jgi:CHRD domain